MSEDYVVHIKGQTVQDGLSKPGHWVIANIEQSIGWPEEDIIIKYEGSDLFLLTYNDEHDFMPAVAINLSDGLSNDEARAKITRFLSALNWVSSGSLRITYWLGGGRPVRSKDTKGMKYTARFFRVTYLPTNLNNEQLLALALLREGDGLSHTHYGYSFLSYYKIINLVKKNGEKQKRWIRNNLGDLKGDTEKRVNEINNDGENVEDYLYHSCRCALAHAGVDPTVNPDDANDSVRLYKDLPLIRQLAVRMIESHFSIKTDSTVYKQHIYETSGFKKLIGNDIVSEILSTDAISRKRIKIGRKISIRQWCDKRYGVFDSLSIKATKIHNGVIFFSCFNEDLTFKIPLIVDLSDDRIYLEIEDAEISTNDEKTQLQYRIDWNKFFRDFVGNGQLEIFLEDDESLLGRKDANIPVNIDLGRTIDSFNTAIEQLQAKLDEHA
jgi:hypothetical protein